MNIDHRKPDAEVLQTLLVSHQRFLAFLENRVGSREDAEEILQSAFAKAVQQEDSLKGETVVAWFFQVLRNALIDHYRHKNVEKRAIERHQVETELQQNDFAELKNRILSVSALRNCFQPLSLSMANF
jgi:RNA polymerase sigma-70 factor (ECF subfamily)